MPLDYTARLPSGHGIKYLQWATIPGHGRRADDHMDSRSTATNGHPSFCPYHLTIRGPTYDGLIITYRPRRPAMPHRSFCYIKRYHDSDLDYSTGPSTERPRDPIFDNDRPSLAAAAETREGWMEWQTVRGEGMGPGSRGGKEDISEAARQRERRTNTETPSVIHFFATTITRRRRAPPPTKQAPRFLFIFITQWSVGPARF